MGQDADKIEEIRAPEAAEDARTRVFLSYSRKDGEAMGRIADGLQQAGFLADFDKAISRVEEMGKQAKDTAEAARTAYEEAVAMAQECIEGYLEALAKA